MDYPRVSSVGNYFSLFFSRSRLGFFVRETKRLEEVFVASSGGLLLCKTEEASPFATVCHRVHRRREHLRLLLCASTEGASAFAAVCVDGGSIAVCCVCIDGESCCENLWTEMSGRGRGRGEVRSKTLPYTPLCSPHLTSQPSSSASTGQPQQHVEELQHEVPTNPPQWLPQYEDRIKACWDFKADERFQGLMKEVRLAWKEATQPSSWFHPEIEKEIERPMARANEESNAAIKQLQENYRKEIDELKKLIISSRNQHEQDDEASE
ncbi:uncharacterized protein G2W53_041479 [Senna tora]|uniref:Uncharacterized protein n=1 Tax=Senna tora TaxID=362788 RepID=A0A834VY03_9FABA|nr:uncharacterized protein G2W53_041479 [Senna tora]